MLSPEISDILTKLLKSDDDNATGDVQLLCKLFSGEKSSYHYSTTDNRVIDKNVPFSILGSTQLVNAAKLIAKMDQGHGLVDRLLIASPMALRPTLTQIEEAKACLETEIVQDFDTVFARMDDIDESTKFTFDANGKVLMRETMDTFVTEVNEAIQEGRVPPKSKKTELIPKVAAALHVFNHFMEDLLNGKTATDPPTTIAHTTLESATALVNHLESQKDILCQVFKRCASNYISSYFNKIVLSNAYFHSNVIINNNNALINRLLMISHNDMKVFLYLTMLARQYNVNYQDLALKITPEQQP